MKPNRHKTSKVSIDIYDLDGEICEQLGGSYDAYDLKAQMIDILRNDGIPVVRCHGKHEAADPAPDRKGEETSPRCKGSPAPQPNPAFEQPMTLRIEFEDIKFMAVGKYEDVMDAQAEFLQAIFEE